MGEHSYREIFSLVYDRFFRGWRVFSGLLIGVASTFGAIGLLAICAELLSWVADPSLIFGGLLEPVLLFWSDTWRPVAEWFLKPLVSLLNMIFGVEVYIPKILHDYLGVGLAFAVGRFRGALGGWRGGAPKAASWVMRKPLKIAGMALSSVFLWPRGMVYCFRVTVQPRNMHPGRPDEDYPQIIVSHAIPLVSVVIAFVLLIANLVYLGLTGWR